MNLKKEDLKDYNVLAFAFLGDAVHSLIIRERLVSGSKVKAGKLHSEATSYIKAASQAAMLEKVMSLLDEDEERIARTARNAKSNNIPKSSNLAEYKKSTAFEAVLGYNYLLGNIDRIKFLIEEGEKCK